MNSTMTPTPGSQLKHVLVREYLRDLVAEVEPGTATPSERELVARFGVARMTVRQAMDALVAEGLLERVPGRGTFVKERRNGAVRLSGYTEDMTRRGLLAESQTLIARREKAGPGVARALGLTPGDPVIHWQRLRRADAQPMCLEDAYLSEVLIPGFLQSGMPTSIYAALEQRGLRPTWAEDSVRAELPTAEEAALLEIGEADPVLKISRRALCRDRPVEVSRSTYRADRYTHWVQLVDGH